MEVGLMPDADDLGELPERQRLFVSSHSWALATATPLTLVAMGPDRVQATAPHEPARGCAPPVGLRLA